MADKTNYKRFGARYKARRRAVDLLFEAEARDLDPVELVEQRRAIGSDRHDAEVSPVADYTVEVVTGVAYALDGVDEAIVRQLVDWELTRLPAVDRAILRLAVWELLYNPDIPVKVAVTEAVELAAEFSTDQAPAYINAVLDGVSRHAEQARQAQAAVAAALLSTQADTDASLDAPAEAQPEESTSAEVSDTSAVATDRAEEAPAASAEEVTAAPTEDVTAAPADEALAPTEDLPSADLDSETVAAQDAPAEQPAPEADDHASAGEDAPAS